MAITWRTPLFNRATAYVRVQSNARTTAGLQAALQDMSIHVGGDKKQAISAKLCSARNARDAILIGMSRFISQRCRVLGICFVVLLLSLGCEGEPRVRSEKSDKDQAKVNVAKQGQEGQPAAAE